MATPKVTAVLSSAGRRGALVRALREGAAVAGVELRLIATDCSVLSAAGHLCDDFLQVPRIDSPDYLAAMLRLVDEQRPDVVIPTIDTELAPLAENTKLFLDFGCEVLISDRETIEICSDKERFGEWLESSGFPTPRRFGWDEVVGMGVAEWPLFFKPRDGSSSVGAHAIRSITELAAATERYGRGVVQELVNGDEFTVDCWVDQRGVCRATVPRRRIAVRAGEVSKSQTVKLTELERLAVDVCEALPAARGPVTLQAIQDGEGFQVIEINPRFGGGFPLSHEAGAAYTAALLAEAAEMAVDPSWFDWKPGITMLRYDDAVFIDSSSDPAAS